MVLQRYSDMNNCLTGTRGKIKNYLRTVFELFQIPGGEKRFEILSIPYTPITNLLSNGELTKDEFSLTRASFYQYS